MAAPLYTQEQLDIALIKNTQEGIVRSLTDMKSEIHVMRADMRDELYSMHSDIKSHGHWSIGLILGIYAMIGAAALGKIFGIL